VGLFIALITDNGVISIEVHFGNVGETSTDGLHSLAVILTDEGNGIDILLAGILGRYLFILPTVGDSSFNASFICVWVVSIFTLSAGNQVIHTGDVSVLLAFINGFNAELLEGLILIQPRLILTLETLVLGETVGLAFLNRGVLETLVVTQIISKGTQLTSGDILFVPGTIVDDGQGIAFEFVGADGEVVGAFQTHFIDCIICLTILDAPIDHLSVESMLAFGTSFF